MPKYQMNWICEVTIELEAASEEESMELAYEHLSQPWFADDLIWDCNECIEMDWEEDDA